MKNNKYRLNPLSAKSSNISVEVIYSSGKSLLYNNIHYPDSYIQTILGENPDIVGAKVYVNGKFSKEYERGENRLYKKRVENKPEPDNDLPF